MGFVENLLKTLYILGGIVENFLYCWKLCWKVVENFIHCWKLCWKLFNGVRIVENLLKTFEMSHDENKGC